MSNHNTGSCHTELTNTMFTLLEFGLLCDAIYDKVKNNENADSETSDFIVCLTLLYFSITEEGLWENNALDVSVVFTSGRRVASIVWTCWMNVKGPTKDLAPLPPKSDALAVRGVPARTHPRPLDHIIQLNQRSLHNPR